MIDVVLPELFKKIESIDLNCRHGSVLATGEIIYALSKIWKSSNRNMGDNLPENLLEQTRNLVPSYRERQFFRGMGGELMKLACSDFIEKCSLASVPFHSTSVIGKFATQQIYCSPFNDF